MEICSIIRNCSITACLLFSMSCSRYGQDICEALRFAGDNRSELESVLRHYSEDKSDRLKHKAALYLVGNMTYHRSYPAEPYAEYCRTMDSISLTNMDNEAMIKAMEKISARFAPELKPIYDIRHITADYLIWNIEYSFFLWETVGWLQHLDFEEFCEYVLPYKCVDLQPMTHWKEDYAAQFRGDVSLIENVSSYRNNPRLAVLAHQIEVWRKIKMRDIPINCIKVFDIKTLSDMRYGNCYDRCVLGLMNSRSKGVPVTLDFTPAWPDRNGSHHWNNVLMPNRSNIDYEPFGTQLGDYHYSDCPFAKVYRNTYRANDNLLDVLRNEKFLPGSLSGALFSEDVTAEYCRTKDAKVSVKKTDSEYAYLCVFNGGEWTPVAVAKISHGHARFKNVGTGIIYTVATYEGGQQKIMDSPFLFNADGMIKYINADRNRTQDLHVVRKFPAFGHIYAIKKHLRGGIIEAADNPEFQNSRVMAKFSEWNLLAGAVKDVDTTALRYWRIVTLSDESDDFAELYFYERDSGKKLTGNIFYPNYSDNRNEHNNPFLICDGNPLTYFSVMQVRQWVGFDFGRTVQIGEIGYIRRGDGNDICPGQTYELYYWDAGKWQLHDVQKAEHVYIDFADVPADALYYIKCTTSGGQNRIFLYKDEEQVWY